MSNTVKRKKEKHELKEKRHDEILKAAEELFQRNGIRETKMTDIAKHCELSKGSLYVYFESKDEIVWNLLLKYSLKEYRAGADYVDSIDGNSYQKLATYFDFFTNQLLESYNANSPSYQYREYMMDMASKSKLTDEMKTQFRELVSRNLSTMTNLIEQGTKDHSISTGFEVKALGNAIGTSMGAYFNYLIALKASFDGDFITEKTYEFKTFTKMILSVLKNNNREEK